MRCAFAAALRGDTDAIGQLLADDVRWHAVGDEGGGCQNRDQALAWMGEAIAHGIHVELLDVKALDERRVLVLLQRNPPREGDPNAEAPTPHGQIVTFTDDKVSEIVVYASDEEAVLAAGEH